MNKWENRAIALLDKCFATTPTELNELDWKLMLSDNNARLAQHLSAFANYPDGGFLVFGIDDYGKMSNVDRKEADEIVHKLGSIARQTLAYPILLDHSIMEYKGFRLLFVYIKENAEKPVSLKSEGILGAYIRSAKQTVKMSEDEIRNAFAASNGLTFEKKISRGGLTADEVLQHLGYKTYLTLLGKTPASVLPNNVIEMLEQEDFIVKNEVSGLYSITNLGAIVLSKDLEQEGILKTKRVRLIHFKGTNRLNATNDVTGKLGYALSFPRLVKYIIDSLPKNEMINTAIRMEVPLYPEVALREFIANALIHQDFTISGSNVTIEIYDDRIEITNPGIPLIDINRIIDTMPRARNYALSDVLRRLGICEKRGSGVQRSLTAIETYQLPAPKFIKGDNFTKIIMYAPIKYQDMSEEDRIRACYQHCALSYVSSKKVNNESVRERFNISKNNYPMATKIINDTISAGWIKIEDPLSESTKTRTYIPFWA